MKRFLAVAVAASVWAVAVLAQDNVASLADALEKPQAGPAVTVKDVVIKLSPNMTIRLASGNAAPVTAAGAAIGLFFAGNGSFEYRAADPLEDTIVRFEAKKASDLEVATAGQATVLKGRFEQLYLRAAAIALPDLQGAAGSNLSEALAKHRESMARRREQSATPLLILQKFDHPSSPVAIAEFTGGGNPIIYTLDTIDARSETVESLTRDRMFENRELAGMWWPVTISDQPVGRSRRDFTEPLYLLTGIDYTLVSDDKEQGRLSVTETITPRTGSQRVFHFALHSTIYDTSERPRTFNLRSVKDAAGRDLPFVHAHENLVVGMPQKMAQNEPFQIRYEIDGDFLFHPNADSYWELGTSPWFPQPDLNGQYYTIHSIVKVKKPWIAFAPGETIRKGEEGDFNVVENRIDKPVQFAVVLAGKYAVDEKKYEDGPTIRVASYAMPNDRAMKQLNNLAYKLIKFYELFLGPFPFKEFNVIEIHELGFGQAPPATMFITKEAFNPLMGEDNQLFSRGVNHRFAHEIAHQYWGHVVKMGSAEEQWVTESFAEYSSALAIKQLKGNGAYNAMISTWRANANEARSVSSISLANRIRVPNNDMDTFRYRTFLIYDKGAYILASMHKQLGDDKFISWLANLQHLFAWRYLTTLDAARLLQRIDGGKDWMPFFNQYYWGTDMPKME
ncbi:MAG TPA: M1 family aminopeptidase [Thermoanaerobaculia bacterium]|nr:M1 family aminopeptidase [Thermoanaerobaculia bacterium]